MGEVFTKTFFTIGTVEPGKSYCFIPGISEQPVDLWKCGPEVWKWDEPVEITGACITLLCAPTGKVEIYACVSQGLDINPEHNFAAMKREHLFYVQRDSYAPCAGVSDLTSWQPLPKDDYFSVSKEKPIYVKVGVCNWFKNKKIAFDVIVTLLYKPANM